jgi:hypothetical protein
MGVVVILVMMGWGYLRQVLQEVDWHIVCFEYVREERRV